MLLVEFRALGYTGGPTILKDFVRPLKAEFVWRVTERFETLDGQPMKKRENQTRLTA